MEDQRLTVLVVEADTDEQHRIQELMRQTGFSDHTVFAADPAHVMEAVIESTPPANPRMPDLILVNLLAQDPRSWDQVSLLKHEARLTQVPILALSDSDDAQLVQQAYRDGVTSLLLRPQSEAEWVPLFESLRLYWSRIVRLPYNGRRWISQTTGQR